MEFDLSRIILAGSNTIHDAIWGNNYSRGKQFKRKQYYSMVKNDPIRCANTDSVG